MKLHEVIENFEDLEVEGLTDHPQLQSVWYMKRFGLKIPPSCLVLGDQPLSLENWVEQNTKRLQDIFTGAQAIVFWGENNGEIYHQTFALNAKIDSPAFRWVFLQAQLEPTWIGTCTTQDSTYGGEYVLKLGKPNEEPTVFSGKEGFYARVSGPELHIPRPRMMDIMNEAQSFASQRGCPQEMTFLFHQRKILYWLYATPRPDLASQTILPRKPGQYQLVHDMPLSRKEIMAQQELCTTINQEMKKYEIPYQRNIVDFDGFLFQEEKRTSKLSWMKKIKTKRKIITLLKEISRKGCNNSSDPKALQKVLSLFMILDQCDYAFGPDSQLSQFRNQIESRLSGKTLQDDKSGSSQKPPGKRVHIDPFHHTQWFT